MCILLGDFLRGTLQVGSLDRIPLSQELALVDQFLQIEQVRFGERLRVERVVEPETLPCAVPPCAVPRASQQAIPSVSNPAPPRRTRGDAAGISSAEPNRSSAAAEGRPSSARPAAHSMAALVISSGFIDRQPCPFAGSAQPKFMIPSACTVR